MKNKLSFAAISALSLLTFSNCKKETTYTCKCEINGSVTEKSKLSESERNTFQQDCVEPTTPNHTFSESCKSD